MRRHFDNPEQWRRKQKGDKIWFGLALAALGIFLMLKKMGLFFFDWHSFWPIILIAVGLLIGVKKKFRNHAWWILILIGGAHLVPEFMIGDTSSSSLVFPLALVIGGIAIAFRSRKNSKMCENPMQVVTNTDNDLNIDVTFGGRKEIITSKEFKGGTVSATFGGVEVNMIQADSTVQPMVLNMKISFSGAELIVPSHWDVQNEISPSFGSVEDHRGLRTQQAGEDRKVLILRGSCNFASIEIKSY